VPSILDGKYELVKAAGAGGTANVYLAQSPVDGTKVAVKVLKKALASDRDMLGRFRREAEVLQRIQHPNVVKLLELADAPEGLLLIMEWAEGERLDTLTLEPAEVRTVLRQLAGALEAVHGAGVVHRDLKPENVIVQRQGALHCWLLDLGIARFLDAAQAQSHFLTARGQGAGTPSFLSPEQIRGESPDTASDVYSFGVLGWRLATGRLPFEAKSDFEVMQLHLEEKPPAFTPLDASLADLEPLLRKCLEKKRAARPKDGTALVAALEAPPPKKRRWPFG